MLTTKQIAQKYGLKETQVRRILRKSGVKKVDEGFYWWIDSKDQKKIEKIFSKYRQ